jgi:hypothetical protein
MALLLSRLAVGGSGQCTTLPGHMSYLCFLRSLLHADRCVSSKGFIFSICFIPSVDHTATASGVGSSDRIINDEIASHARRPGAPYIMRHLHTVAEELGSCCSHLPPHSLEVSVWYRLIQETSEVVPDFLDYPRIGEFPHAPQGYIKSVFSKCGYDEAGQRQPSLSCRAEFWCSKSSLMCSLSSCYYDCTSPSAGRPIYIC